MPDIHQIFSVNSTIERVYSAITTPKGLDAWWTKRSKGEPRLGNAYELWFGPQHDWRATVTACEPDTAFEMQLTSSDEDWLDTRVGFSLSGAGDRTEVAFHHTGWADSNRHYRISCYCWAMYLRLMRRYVETGEIVSYESRLDA